MTLRLLFLMPLRFVLLGPIVGAIAGVITVLIVGIVLSLKDHGTLFTGGSGEAGLILFIPALIIGIPSAATTGVLFTFVAWLFPDLLSRFKPAFAAGAILGATSSAIWYQLVGWDFPFIDLLAAGIGALCGGVCALWAAHDLDEHLK